MRSAARGRDARQDPRASGAGQAASTSWVDTVLQEILTATFWFDPGTDGEPYAATVRFRGRRTRVSGKPSARDSFVQEETIDPVVPGTGPVSVTTRVYGINPGKWVVTAEPVARAGARPRPLFPAAAGTAPRRPWPWVRVEPTDERALQTAIAPLARVPGVIPGAYSVLVALGMLFGVLLLLALVDAEGIARGPVLGAAVAALLAGLAGGKTYYIVQQRGKRFEGWCVQGFVPATALAGLLALVLLGLPAGVVLNAAAPALFLGVAIGRPGCFLAGCCGGRATSAPWGLWCSDQRVGARRIPTQLVEALLGLAIGVTTLVLFTQVRPLLPGALLVGAVAAYTLGRQLILPLRSDPRMRSSTGRTVTVVLAALVLGIDVLLSTLV